MVELTQFIRVDPLALETLQSTRSLESQSELLQVSGEGLFIPFKIQRNRLTDKLQPRVPVSVFYSGLHRSVSPAVNLPQKQLPSCGDDTGNQSNVREVRSRAHGEKDIKDLRNDRVIIAHLQEIIFIYTVTVKSFPCLS